MKKQLIFTAALLFVAFTTFGQATVLDPLDSETQISIASTDYTQTGGPFAPNGNGAHLNATIPEVLNGSISFDVVSSGADFETSIVFHVRKLFGNSGSVTMTVDGTTDAPITLAADPNASNLNGFETFNTLTFSQNVTITSVPKTITLDINILQDLSNSARIRFYWLKFSNESLGIDDFETQETSVKVYPNPATNSFKIDSNNNVESVKLYSVTGQLLKSFSEEVNYNISDLATGIYLANVKTELGSKTLRIVKE